MPLTTTIIRTANTELGKVTIAEVTFDASYPTGGETLDLTAAPFTGVDLFTTVTSVGVIEGPYLSTGARPAITLCVDIAYDPAAARAVATGVLLAHQFSAADATGLYQQVADTTNMSTVLCRLLIVGT